MTTIWTKKRYLFNVLDMLAIEKQHRDSVNRHFLNQNQVVVFAPSTGSYITIKQKERKHV